MSSFMPSELTGTKSLLIEEMISQVCLNEEYFGQHPELLRAEQALNTAVDKTTGRLQPSKFIGKVQDTVEKCFAKCFNVKNVYIGVDKTDAEINAYCIPLMKEEDFKPFSNSTLSTDEITKDKHGYKFAKQRETLLMLTTTSALSILTPRQFIAVFLHEVGHAIQDIPVLVKSCMLLTSIIQGPSLETELRKIKETSSQNKAIKTKKEKLKFDKIPKNNSVLLMIHLWYHSILMFLNYWAIVAHGVTIGAIVYILYTLLPNFITTSVFQQQAQERFSDSFAAMYGYGPELRDALFILQKESKDQYRHNNTIAVYYAVRILSVLNAPFSTHPSNEEREATIRKELKREMRSTQDPRIKKEIEGQIKIIDDTAEDVRKKYRDFDDLLDSVIRWPFDLLVYITDHVFAAGRSIKMMDLAISLKKKIKELFG